MRLEEYRGILIRMWFETMRRLNNNNYNTETSNSNAFWDVWRGVVQDVVGYILRGNLPIPHDQNRYGSYESHPPAVVRLNQSYNAYNEYRPASEYSHQYNPEYIPEYNPPTMTRQQLIPYDNDPRGIWRHTSQIPTFRPREINPLKRRRSRSHLDDVFLPNHDGDECYKNGRQERNRYAYGRRNLHQITREDNRKSSSLEGAKMCYDKRQKLDSKKPSKEAPVHNATKDNEQATVNNKNNCKSSLPSEKVHKSGAEEQPTKKSDESAMISNDSTSSDLFKDIITTKSYLADRFSDTNSSCDFTENLSVVDMEISSQESTPKKMIIDQSCVDDHDKGIKELKNIHKNIDAMIMDKLKEPQNTSEGNNIEAIESSGDQIKNVVNIKGYKEPQNASERNNATKKSEEVNKTVLSDIHSKNVAYMQKIESERKTEGDNKVDMLYKRSESKESVSYRITPGYIIPKKIQAPQPSKQKAFSDINDVYSTDTRVLFQDLIGMSKSTGDVSRRKNDMKGTSDKTKPPNSRSHPDMLNTNSIHTNSNTSKPETSAVRLGMGPKVSNFRRSLDQSRSPIDYSSIEANVPNSKSYNCVPKKISFRRYSDRRRSVESSKSESNISPVSPFRSPVDASNLSDSSSKSSSCNRPESTLKSSNSDRNSDYNSISPSTLVDSDNRSSKPGSVDTSQNASRSENVQTKFGTARSKAPPGNRSLFKSSNQIRPGGDGRTNSVPHGSHITPKSDCVENGFRRYYYTIQWDKCKAERSNVRPADDRNNQRKEAGGDKSIRLAGRPISLSGNARDIAYDSSSQDSSYSARSRENISSKHSAADLSSDETTDSSRDSGYKKSESVSGNRSTSNNSKNMKLNKIVDRDKVPKIRPNNTTRLSLDSKLEKSKMKRKMDNKTSTIARKKQRLDKRSSATSVPGDPRSHATSNMEKQNKSNNSDLELTSEKGISNTKAGLIVILEKASTKPTSSLGKTHSGSTSNNSSDDSTVNNLTTDLPSSSHTGVSHEHPKNVESGNICEIKEKIHNDLSDAASQKCDEHKSGHADKSEVPSQNLSYNDFDPVEEAVKSVVNGNRVSEDVFVALRKISASNNDENKLKVTSNNLISDPHLDQEGVITPIKEESDMLVNNIKKSVDGKSKDNSPEVTKIPLDIKSHTISTTSQDMYTNENLGNIEQIFDGKNTVLVSSSEVTVQIVESNLCHADVFSVSSCESLSIKMHEVSITSFEAGTCSPLPDFTFEPGKAKSSLIEPPDYDTVTILKPAEIIESAVYVYKIVEEQDIPIIDLIDDKPDSLEIPIIDLIDDKPDSHVIDLTEEVDVKKEEPVDDAADIYDLLKKAADSSEQITLYRSDETVNDSLDVQVTSVSISPPKSEVKQESDGDDEVKKEMDEESEEPDSIFTEIELLNISRKTAKPEPVKMEVDEPASEEIIYIKDELDNNTPESASKEGTDSRGLGNAEKISTETFEKEKEPQTDDAQCEVKSVQNVSAILSTDNVVLGNESSCSSENISGNDSAIGLVGTTQKIPESTSQDDPSNQGCIASRNTAKDRHNEPVQEKVVKSKSVEAEIVDALHKIDEIIEKEENNRAINKISSQPSASITESSEEGTQQPVPQQPSSIPTSTPTTSVTVLQNEALNPPVVSQPTISPQTSFEASASYGTDNSIQRNNVVQDTRRDGSSETQSPSVIQTQDSLLQQDIWNISGILAKYLIRMHCLKACCDNYNRMLALYKLIDPTMYHNESNVMSELHERRLCAYATAMKASLQHYTFNLPPIPEDVLKVTFNRVKKLLPLPHLDIRWIIFVLFSLMKKQATYYYSHVSLKYLYIYLTSASQQLNGPNRNVLVQQQLLQQQQHLAPDQLCALKNQIQQFNNICSTQQQLLNSKPKPQTTKTTTQRKRASKRSNISENPNPSTTNGKNQVQLRRSPPSYAESVSSRQQDPNNSTRVASAINPKTMAQLLQATPQAQSSSRVVSGTMTSPTHTMSVPNTSSAHFSTPVIKLKDPSSLMQDISETTQTTPTSNTLERLLGNFPCANASPSTRQNMAGNINSLGCTPRSGHMTPSFGTTSSPMHQPSNLTGSVDGRNAQEHVYAPLPNPTSMSPAHNAVSTQRVQSNVSTTSARQHGMNPATQQLLHSARPNQTTIPSPACCTICLPRNQISDLPVTNDPRKPHMYSKRSYPPHPAYASQSHSATSSNATPSRFSKQGGMIFSSSHQLSDHTRHIGASNTPRLSAGLSPAHISSPAHGPSDRTESTNRHVYAPTVLPNVSSVRVPNQNLHSVGMSPAHNYFVASPAHRLSDRAESAVAVHQSPAQRRDRNIQSVAMSPTQQTSNSADSINKTAYYDALLHSLLSQMPPSRSDTSSQNDSGVVSPARSSRVPETLHQTGSIAAELSQRLGTLTPKQPVTVQSRNGSNQSPRISPLSSDLQLNTNGRSPAHQLGNQTSDQTAGSGFLSSANQFTESTRTCSATSSANNVQHAQLGTSAYAGSTTNSAASTPRISPDAPTGSLTTASSMFPNMGNESRNNMTASPVTASTPAHGTSAANTPGQLVIHLDDDENPDTTPVYAPMLFPQRYDQLSTSTASASPVSHVSDDAEVIDLTWIDDLDEERLEMEVDEMVKKEELEDDDDDEVVINNIDHFAVINDSQKYPPV